MCMLLKSCCPTAFIAAPACCFSAAAGSLQGHLLLRSLPMLPNLPRPGDVTASELVAPSMFPLRAVATMEPTGVAAVAAGSPAGTTAAKPAAATVPAAPSTGAGGAAQPAGPQQQARSAEGSPAARSTAQRRNFWQRLLARAGREQQDPPVELLIRVDGRGLANVTGAWIEGIPPTPAAAPANKISGNASGGEGKPGTGSTSGSGGSSSNMAQVTILQQPQAPLLLPLRERPMLPVVSQLSAFVSWLAVTLGWVTLLRQLQPPGRSDFRLARVRLPASAVRDAQRAAQVRTHLQACPLACCACWLPVRKPAKQLLACQLGCWGCTRAVSGAQPAHVAYTPS